MERNSFPLSSNPRELYLESMPTIVTPSLNGVHSTLTSPASAVDSSDKFDEEENDENQRSSSVGPQRSSSLTSSCAGKEKRKRSRVTPNQLEELERYFTSNRSPNGAQRREISERLGMYERQTQIWFQNRRAKAKLLDGKPADVADKIEFVDASNCEPIVDRSPETWTDVQTVQSLVHEAAPILVIPSPEIKMGAWKRQSCQSGSIDLICYICDSRQCLVWFVHNAGIDFKMEVPFNTIYKTELLHKPDKPKHRNATAILILMQPPIFMIQDTRVGGGEHRWQRCGDWTEGRQASQVLQHELTGNVKHINHILSMVARRLQPGQHEIPLVCSYPHHSTIPATGLEISQPQPIPVSVALPAPATGHLPTEPTQQHMQVSYASQHHHYSSPPNYVVEQHQSPSPNHSAYMQTSYTNTTRSAMPSSSQQYVDYSLPNSSVPVSGHLPSPSFDATPRAACPTIPNEYYNQYPLQTNQHYLTNTSQLTQQPRYNSQYSGMTGVPFDNQGYYGQGMSA